jgi:HEAT repeat protein
MQTRPKTGDNRSLVESDQTGVACKSMTWNRRITPYRRGWVAALLVVICLGAWLTAYRAQPRHEGISARAWLEDLVRPDRDRKAAAADAFQAMGAAAVPGLAKALNRRESPVRRALQWATANLATIDLDIVPAAQYRIEALNALARMGATARPAVPALLGVLEDGPDPPEARAIQAILTAMDADMIAELLPVLERTEDLQVVRVTLATWNELLSPALVRADVLTAVRSRAIGYLAWSDDQVVIAAVSVLGRLKTEGATAIPHLIEVLRTPSRTTGPVAEQVVLALGRIGCEPGLVVPVLAGCLSEEDPRLRIRAVTALAMFGPEAAAAAPALEQALADADPYVRGRAALALGQLGTAAAPAVSGLAAALSDQDESVQVAVIEALGAIGPQARPALPQLHRAWSNKQSGLGHQVRAALKRIETDSLE